VAVLAFLRNPRDAFDVSTEAVKAAHGRRLTVAMARKPIDRERLAEALDVDRKTVTNWRTGKTMPSAADLLRLERILGPYNAEGDPVEVALLESGLTEDRKYDVIGYYKRQMREQAESEQLMAARFVGQPGGLDIARSAQDAVLNESQDPGYDFDGR
jgi:transcriptional regulator with XRE-family HTH domain